MGTDNIALLLQLRRKIPNLVLELMTSVGYHSALPNLAELLRLVFRDASCSEIREIADFDSNWVILADVLSAVVREVLDSEVGHLLSSYSISQIASQQTSHETHNCNDNDC